MRCMRAELLKAQPAAFSFHLPNLAAEHDCRRIYIHTTTTSEFFTYPFLEGRWWLASHACLPALVRVRSLASHRICILARASTWNETDSFNIYKNQSRTRVVTATAWQQVFFLKEKKRKVSDADGTRYDRSYVRIHPFFIFGLHLGILYGIL